MKIQLNPQQRSFTDMRILLILGIVLLHCGALTAQEITHRLDGTVSMMELRTLLPQTTMFETFEVTIDHPFCIDLMVLNTATDSSLNPIAPPTRHESTKCELGGEMRLIFKVAPNELAFEDPGYALTFGYLVKGRSSGASTQLLDIGDRVIGIGNDVHNIELSEDYQTLIDWRLTTLEKSPSDRKHHTLEFRIRKSENPSGFMGSPAKTQKGG